MDFSLPENIQDLILYDVDGTEIEFKDKEDLDKIIQNCNIRPVISVEDMGFDEDGNLTPKFVISSINIDSYIDPSEIHSK
jgi:hypothetical protein